jgi:hypothetical protein
MIFLKNVNARILIEVLTSKKATAMDSITTLKRDSIQNSIALSERIAKLEAGNFPMMEGETPRALFADGDMVEFEGKKGFIDSAITMLNSLEVPMYVFVNYSQDVSTGSYLQRAQAARPKGLPDGVKYVVITLVNIPGV